MNSRISTGSSDLSASNRCCNFQAQKRYLNATGAELQRTKGLVCSFLRILPCNPVFSLRWQASV